MALITEAYRQQQRELHKNPSYGVASLEYAKTVAAIVLGNDFEELLDYGAGKMRLRDALTNILDTHPLRYHAYEPASDDPVISGPPEPRDFVACIDVLEHVEPECLDDVLDHIRRCMKIAGFLTVHTAPAVKKLPDGRNAHLIQKPASWWLPTLCERFEPLRFEAKGNDFWILVRPKA